MIHAIAPTLICLLLSALAPNTHAFGPTQRNRTSEGTTLEAPSALDTGLIQALPGDREDAPIAAFHLHTEGALWMRLFFAEVQLAEGASVRITALEDGFSQTLDRESLRQWENSTAYFNGDVVLVEVLGGTDTAPNRVKVERVRYGIASFTLATICGDDDRLAASDPNIARLLPIACTGFLIDDNQGGMLGAGHCMGRSRVAQFNVPTSKEDGSFNHPAPSDQYMVDQASVQTNGGQGSGDDWAYFGLHRNTETGTTVREMQGPGLSFRPPPLWSAEIEIRLTGYGIDAGPRNQVLQTSTGEWLPFAGEIKLLYGADSKGGNSGSPIVVDGTRTAIGIHTHGGCALPTFGNSGTSSQHPDLQAALALPLGVLAGPGVRPGIASRAGTANNPVFLSSPDRPVVGRPWSFVVDASTHSGATLVVTQGRMDGATGSLRAMGQLLLDLRSPLVFQTVSASSGGVDTQTLTIPNDTVLAGLSTTVQAAILGGAGPQLGNALDLLIGCAPIDCP